MLPGLMITKRIPIPVCILLFGFIKVLIITIIRNVITFLQEIGSIFNVDF